METSLPPSPEAPVEHGIGLIMFKAINKKLAEMFSISPVVRLQRSLQKQNPASN
jgi:hypothetical protein